jgi:hypothetical protein
MKIRALLLFLLAGLIAAPCMRAQTPAPSSPQVSAATGNTLTIDEQLKLRAAQQKAAADPAVKAALQKRNQAIDDFRAALRAAMIKVDPAVAPIVDKIEIPSHTKP